MSLASVIAGAGLLGDSSTAVIASMLGNEKNTSTKLPYMSCLRSFPPDGSHIVYDLRTGHNEDGHGHARPA